MARYWLISISLLCPGVAFASPQPIVVELRLDGDAVEALAWRDGDGDILVDAPTLSRMGLALPANMNDQIPLSAVPGLSYQLDESQGAVDIECHASCFAANTIRAERARNPVGARTSGGFLNLDLAATHTGQNNSAAGLFELGIFNRYGAGSATWTADTERGDALRLETQWTIDRPDLRTMLRFGDSFTRGGATGVPVRFGGVQFATDFSLDPAFTAYPTPTLRGEAATPSTVDLYIDGALRLRSNVDSGPFSIPNAPVLTGAGLAQVVVTDALGRQQIFAQPFYASASMLRRGLSDYSMAIGAERENFAQASNDYGRGFASGFYRYGLTNWLTAEAHVETSASLRSVAAAGSVASAALGQVDLSYARSEGAHDGQSLHASWQRQSDALSFGLDITHASRGFRRIGEDWSAAPPRLQTAASAGFNLHRYGTATAAYTIRDARDHALIRTIALAYTPRSTARGQLQVNAFYVDDESEAPYLTIGVGYALTFGNGVSAGVSAGARGGRASFTAEAQRTPDLEGGIGWRAGAALGEVERVDASLLHLGRRDESSLEYSHTAMGDGLRAQLATGMAWLDGRLIASRPIRDSFALVDAGAANVTILRDRQPVGKTDAHGLILLTGLRPYQSNRIGVMLEDLPLEVQTAVDEIEAIPAARSGIVARFPIAHGAFGEARMLDRDGAPLPAGAILVRQSNGARVPVGFDGRVYIAGLTHDDTFTHADCTFRVRPVDLSKQSTLRCEAA